MQPITHLSLAYLVYEGLQAIGVPINRKGILLGSVFPDADYLLVPFVPKFIAHRTVTHSPFWTAVVAASLRKRCGFWSTWLGGLTHVAADEFDGCDTRSGYWSRLMWLFPLDLRRRPWKRCIFDRGNIPGPEFLGHLVLEGPIVLTALWLVWRKRKR